MDTVVPGEGVKPIVDGDIIRTDGTTVLGGDDKSGCAIICETLHQLREQHIAHGPIDAVFTVCEEIGLLGAELDLSMMQAREGLVYDSDAPGYLFVRAPAPRPALHRPRAGSSRRDGAGARALGDQDRVGGDRRDAPGPNRRRDHRQPRHYRG